MTKSRDKDFAYDLFEKKNKPAIIRYIQAIYKVPLDIAEGIYTITYAMFGVAILAVLVSNQSNTKDVIDASATAFDDILNTAGEKEPDQ